MNLSIKNTERPYFKTLPPEFRRSLEQFSDRVKITDENLSTIWISLLEALNNQELSSGYSPLFPNRILPDTNELIVWIGANFSIYIEKENDLSLRSIWENMDKRVCLVYFDEIERFDFIWEQDIEKKFTNRTELKIIYNYKEILPLVTNFKNTMQQKIGHLPYLGETKGNGECFLLDKKIWRPDYDKINTAPAISLQTCIYTLLGIDDLFLIATIKDHLDFIDDVQGGLLREDDFIGFPSVLAGAYPKNIDNTIKYREGWRDIISFIENFINAFTRGNNFNLHDINQEPHQCNIETLPFLKWACDRGYPIPVELKPLLQQSIPAIVSKDQEGKEILVNKKPRCFIKQKDGWWKIIFDGESGLFRGKPFDYIAEVLKQPHGVSIDYSILGQLVEGTYIPDSLSLNDELNIESFGRKHSVEELKNMREALETVYQLYLKNPEEHIDSWSTAKATAEKEYGILTKDDDGDLSFSESRWQNETNPDFEKARKTVSANKTRFLKKIQTVKLLSEHFNAYLKTEFGLVYDPPENSPSWEIINK